MRKLFVSEKQRNFAKVSLAIAFVLSYVPLVFRKIDDKKSVSVLKLLCTSTIVRLKTYSQFRTKYLRCICGCNLLFLFVDLVFIAFDFEKFSFNSPTRFELYLQWFFAVEFTIYFSMAHTLFMLMCAGFLFERPFGFSQKKSKNLPFKSSKKAAKKSKDK